jgi:hypothetical protein
MIARGDVAMCIASCSTARLANAMLAEEGSPLSLKVDSDPTNGMMVLPDMESVFCW